MTAPPSNSLVDRYNAVYRKMAEATARLSQILGALPSGRVSRGRRGDPVVYTDDGRVVVLQGLPHEYIGREVQYLPIKERGRVVLALPVYAPPGPSWTDEGEHYFPAADRVAGLREARQEVARLEAELLALREQLQKRKERLLDMYHEALSRVIAAVRYNIVDGGSVVAQRMRYDEMSEDYLAPPVGVRDSPDYFVRAAASAALEAAASSLVGVDGEEGIRRALDHHGVDTVVERATSLLHPLTIERVDIIDPRTGERIGVGYMRR